MSNSITIKKSLERCNSLSGQLLLILYILKKCRIRATRHDTKYIDIVCPVCGGRAYIMYSGLYGKTGVFWKCHSNKIAGNTKCHKVYHFSFCGLIQSSQPNMPFENAVDLVGSLSDEYRERETSAQIALQVKPGDLPTVAQIYGAIREGGLNGLLWACMAVSRLIGELNTTDESDPVLRARAEFEQRLRHLIQSAVDQIINDGGEYESLPDRKSANILEWLYRCAEPNKAFEIPAEIPF